MHTGSIMTAQHKWSLKMQWRGPDIVESHVGANDCRVKMGSKKKAYHVNMLKKYVARVFGMNVAHKGNQDDATIAVTGVIYQDTHPKLGEVPGLSSERRSSRCQNR